MRLALLLPLVFLLPLVPAAHAMDECGGNTPALGEVEIGDGTAAHTFYIDDRNYALGNGMYVYQESNGIFMPHDPVSYWVNPDPGAPHVTYWWVWVASLGAASVNGDPRADLQRGGSSNVIPNDNDACVDGRGSVTPDQLIF